MYIFAPEWFSNSAYNNFKIDKDMNTVKARLYVCGDCANKIKDAGLPKGAYRCPLIVDVINTDVVWDTTDATDCIREGRYHFLGYNDDVDFNDVID